MTENNSEFTQESGVGSSVDVCQGTKQADIPCENSKTDKCVTCDESAKTEFNIKNKKKEEISSMLSTSGWDDELPSLQDHWLKLSTFFKKVYHTILDGEKPPDEYECHVNIVNELVASDPQQLFARLELDLQEFIIEVKLRQIELLNCVHTYEGPQLFIFCLIESYNKLMFAAYTLSPLLLQLEMEHLANFNITWRGLNQHLFHKLIFTEPKVHKGLSVCLNKLGEMDPELSDFNKRLIRQFIIFDGEMSKIGGKWKEVESAFIAYHQENSILDAKQRMMKVNWELIKTQAKVFHEELKSSGIPSELSPDILQNGIANSNGDDNSINYCVCDAEKKSLAIKDSSFAVKSLTNDNFKKVEEDLNTMVDRQLCECCHLKLSQCSNSSNEFNLDSYKEIELSKGCLHASDILCKDAESLVDLNVDEKKMYSHSLKFKSEQTSNEKKNQHSMSMSFLSKDIFKKPLLNSDAPQHQQNIQLSSCVQPSAELHKTLIRKQVIQQQRQQHQKKLMQMMQSSQQKDFQHKIQKQLQEHKLLLQQQRKIDELHAHLLQQHPVHMDKEMQKKVHQQMQQRLMQKHKQMEEKFHQQVQQQIHQQKEKQTTPLPLKLNMSEKSGQIVSSNVKGCSHPKQPLSPLKNNHKYTTPVMATPATVNSSMVVTTNSTMNATTTSTRTTNTSSKTVTVNVSTCLTGVTLKNSTTQTVATSANGQNRVRHHPLPDIVKSASYICPKHSENNKQNMHNNGENDHSSENSSDEDYSSERSNSPQRHCDCCYCEVFGSAPVSRNFQETRERLRLILTKKKAKSNPSFTNGDKSTNEQNVSNSNSANCTLPISQGGNKIKKENSVNTKKLNTVPEYKGDKSIEEILDFIEGTKNRNTKRTAKKLRRKQRQLEEEERKRKEEEEAERLRLEELRKREEEEKKRLEEERRHQELLKEQNRKKNKKKGGKQANQQNSKKMLIINQDGRKNRNNRNHNQLNDKSKVAQNQKANQEQMFKNVNQKQLLNQSFFKQNNKEKKKHGQKQDVLKQQTKQKNLEKQKQQPAQKSNIQKKGAQQNQQQKSGNGNINGTSSGPQMVTIKRVIQPNSNEPTVTITLRGPTPREDKVLYTLLNGQMCQVKEDKNKKHLPPTNTVNNKKLKLTAANKINNNYNQNYKISNANSAIPKNTNFKNCDVLGSGINNIMERMERLKLNPQPVPSELKKFVPSSTTNLAELTTPTAIQINQAVNQLSSHPTFPNNFDLENIKLPPGITITKVDPATVQRKPIQMKQQPPPPSPPQTHIRQSMVSSMPGSSNVIVVDTVDKNNYYQSEGQRMSMSKKKRRRRKKENSEMKKNDLATCAIPYSAANGLPPRMNSMNSSVFGNPFIRAGYGNTVQQPAAIIQMNGSMVTIRNPALHQALTGQQMEYQDGSKTKKNVDIRRPNTDENMFSSPPEEIENGDADDYERELEAFKRFCSQSVPAESKAKVNLNIEDIVLKKKGPVIGCS